MKKVWKGVLILALTLTCGVVSSYAQIFVKVRPSLPRVERIESPGRGYIWINEEWQPRGNDYEFSGRAARWVMPPQEGATLDTRSLARF